MTGTDVGRCDNCRAVPDAPTCTEHPTCTDCFDPRFVACVACLAALREWADDERTDRDRDHHLEHA